MQIIRGTTPTIIINVKDDIDFSQITSTWIFISQRGKVRVDKTIRDITVNPLERRIKLPLSQEDTLNLKEGDATIQVRILMSDGTALSSFEKEIEVLPTGKEGEIEPEQFTPEQWTVGPEPTIERIKLNLIPIGTMPICHASQFDKKRQIEIEIYNGAQPYFLSDEELELIIKKPDGNLVSMDIPYEVGSNSVIFETTEQTCAVAGKCLCELRVTKGESKLGSLNFYLQVEGAPDEGGIQSQSEINNLARQVHDFVVEELEDNGASETGYDNTESGLEATNVQDAIDEVNTKIENIPSVDAYTKEEANNKFATKELVISTLPTDKASGSIVTLTTPFGYPVENLKANLDYNSSGVSEADVYLRGKNLFDDSNINDKSYWTDLGGDNWAYPLALPRNTTITLSGQHTVSGYTPYVYLQKKVNGNWEILYQFWQGNINLLPLTFTTDDSQYRLWAYNAVASIDTIDNMQFEVGEQATAYQNAIGEVKTISLSGLGATIYGGYIEFTPAATKVYSTKNADGTTKTTPVVYTLSGVDDFATLIGTSYIFGDRGDILNCDYITTSDVAIRNIIDDDSLATDKVWSAEKTDSEFDKVNGEIFVPCENKYDSTLQTVDTISPHYFVNGEPYSSTQFDNSWNCTDFIEVEPNTIYTVALVPDYNGIVKPWGSASSGGFLYDQDKKFISGTTFSGNTFTTPANARYLRFNYNIGNGISLSRLNDSCMLVLGGVIPVSYEAYKTKNRLDEIIKAPLQYKIGEDSIEILQGYGDKNLLVTLNKHGGNNLFDYASFYTVRKGVDINEITNANKTLIQTVATDWHAPFQVRAVNNIDGDNINPDTSNYYLYFTGGNHQYNNTGSGSTPTARTTSVKFFVNGKQANKGTFGYANSIRIEWTNRVQGYNTTKADGTGREILEEKHTIIADGERFNEFAQLVALEDVIFVLYYGLQFSRNQTSFPNLRYVGATNRGVYSGNIASDSGNQIPNDIVAYGSSDKLVMGIDTSFDLGKRDYIYSTSKGLFATAYNKCYAKLFDKETSSPEGNGYDFRGYYIFKPV